MELYERGYPVTNLIMPIPARADLYGNPQKNTERIHVNRPCSTYVAVARLVKIMVCKLPNPNPYVK